MKMRIFLLMLAPVALFISGCVPHTTGPTEVGVRTIKLGVFAKKGVEDKIYAPGSTYFFLPFVNDWNTFDTRLFNLDMTVDESKGDRKSRDDLLFKTVDGNDISLDIIVSYRIDPEKAPMILQFVAEDDNELKENIVRTVARSKPRDIFGSLNTEDFYNADKRSAKAEDVKTTLNDILGPYGIIVERVGTRDYRFTEAYQRAIEDKKVADQKAARLKSETKAAKEEFLMKVEEAKGETGKIRATADGEYQRAKIEADAYFQQQESIAKAIEAEGRADAEGIKKMNEALAGSGGAAMVKLDIAEALMNKRIVLLPIGGEGLDVRSTDVNSLLQLYGIQKITGRAADKPAAQATNTPPTAPASTAAPAEGQTKPQVMLPPQRQHKKN
jgi:regulator of protease activity HflC (stomatin/prohibitin superfamily)